MIREFMMARSVSTPVVLITTTDQSSTIQALDNAFPSEADQREAGRKKIVPQPPIIAWDCLRGFVNLNLPGKVALDKILPSDALPGMTPGLNPAEAFTMMLDLDENTIVIMRNAHKEWGEKPIVQGIALVRDKFRENIRTLVLLAPAAMLPSEVVQDVVVIDDPLPDEVGLRAILNREVENSQTPAPDESQASAIVSGLAGLTEYAAESVVALSIAEVKRVDPAIVWRRKRDIIGQIKGLKWDSWASTLDDLGGLDAAREFAAAEFAGTEPPAVIVRIDEIEKQMAGFAGDNTGVSQDMVGTVLREMEDNGWDGLIAVGPPGAGKTIFSRALGATYGVPTIELDLGGVKESLVGASEANIRAALKVIKAIGARRVFFIATCNKLDVLPPELRRRFTAGVWFFDLPTKEERDTIWGLNLKSFGLPLDARRPNDENWTGAEIRNACKRAAKRRAHPADVSHTIVPVFTADPASIKKLRESADGKFLSASTPGVYRLAAPAPAPKRPAGRAYAGNES